MKVAIIMGSKSDFPKIEEGAKLLKEFGVEVEARVFSAHRTPKELFEYLDYTHENNFEIIIAAAGKSAHLPGVIAAHTVKPVIGLPIKSSTMDGLDSLLSIVQMPKGIPVATVAIDGGMNASLLALQILGLKYENISKKLEEHRVDMAKKVMLDNEEVKSLV